MNVHRSESANRTSTPLVHHHKTKHHYINQYVCHKRQKAEQYGSKNQWNIQRSGGCHLLDTWKILWCRAGGEVRVISFSSNFIKRWSKTFLHNSSNFECPKDIKLSDADWPNAYQFSPATTHNWLYLAYFLGCDQHAILAWFIQLDVVLKVVRNVSFWEPWVLS